MLERFCITRMHDDMPYRSYLTATEFEVANLVKVYAALHPSDEYSFKKCG